MKLHLTDTETGETIREVCFRQLLSGEAARVVAAVSSLAQIIKDLEAKSESIEDVGEQFEAVAGIQDRSQGLQGYVLGSMVEGLTLPDAGATWQRGLTVAGQLITEGWTPEEIDVVFNAGVQHATQVGLGKRVGRRVQVLADFSDPQAG